MNISKEPQEGVLLKSNGKWFVDYITEREGENNWHHSLPIFQLDKKHETEADLILVEKFNRPVSELIGLNVKWKYKINYLITDLCSEYAEII